MTELQLTGQFKKDLKRDLLLILPDEQLDVIKLVRFGTHSELSGR